MPSVTLPNGWNPRAYQLPAWKYLEAGGKHAELVWHRRSGKDEIALHRTACAAFERPAGYWHMLPEYAQARKAIWDAVNPHSGKRRIDEAFPRELRKATRNDEMLIEFVNGSTWQVVGSDSYNRLVGSSPAGVVYSEWALANPNARAYLRPILAENGGWQVFITTARGRNHAHKTLEAAKKDSKAFAQVLTVEDTGVLTPEQLEIERLAYIADFGLEYGLAKFEQEYMCSFDAANLGAILAPAIGRIEKLGRIGPHVTHDETQPIIISADIGRSDTSTWYFWQRRIGGYAIIDYDSGFGLDAEEWADKLQTRIADNGYVLEKIWLPHDARAKTFAAKYSGVETFIQKFGAQRVAIVPNSKKSDRVNAARRVIERVEFSDKVDIEGLRAWHYEWDDERKMFSKEPEHDWASHDGDGFSYGCQIMEEMHSKEPEKPAQFPIISKNGKITTVPLDVLWQENTHREQRF